MGVSAAGRGGVWGVTRPGPRRARFDGEAILDEATL